MTTIPSSNGQANRWPGDDIDAIRRLHLEGDYAMAVHVAYDLGYVTATQLVAAWHTGADVLELAGLL